MNSFEKPLPLNSWVVHSYSLQNYFHCFLRSTVKSGYNHHGFSRTKCDWFERAFYRSRIVGSKGNQFCAEWGPSLKDDSYFVAIFGAHCTTLATSSEGIFSMLSGQLQQNCSKWYSWNNHLSFRPLSSRSPLQSVFVGFTVATRVSFTQNRRYWHHWCCFVNE